VEKEIKMLVKDPKGILKVGMKVRYYGRSCLPGYYNQPIIIEGVIGEITDSVFYIFNNTHEGAINEKSPKEMGYKYGWSAYFNAPRTWIEILEEDKMEEEKLSKEAIKQAFEEVQKERFEADVKKAKELINHLFDIENKIKDLKDEVCKLRKQLGQKK
jgi:hypothetical protein